MSCGTCSEATKRCAAAALGAPTATGAALPRLNAETLRYLSGPIIAHTGGEGTVPDWLRQAIPQARLDLVGSGEATLATEEEACAYLMTASLAVPLDHNWEGTYIWVASRVCGKHSRMPQGQDFWTALGHDTPRPLRASADSAGRRAWGQSLNRNQESDLWKLREWLRRGVSKNEKATGRRPRQAHADRSAAVGNDGSPGNAPLPTTAKTSPQGRKAKTKAKRGAK